MEPLREAQLGAYLKRIGLDERPRADAAGLHAVIRAHHTTIPFENLDRHRNVIPATDTDALVDKLVTRRRGGICYELNLLLAAALKALGFRLDLLAGQMSRNQGGFGPLFDHLTLRVHLPDGPVLADAGNGETFTLPLPFDGAWHEDARGYAYRIAPRPEGGFQVERQAETEDEIEVVYLFEGEARRRDEFMPMCTFHLSSPESHFARGWIATLPLPEGRITVARGMLMLTRHGVMERHAIGSAAELAEILRTRFGMCPFEVPAEWFGRGAVRANP